MSSSPSRGQLIAVLLVVLALFVAVLWWLQPRRRNLSFDPPPRSQSTDNPENNSQSTGATVPSIPTQTALNPAPDAGSTTVAAPPRRRLLATDPDPVPAVNYRGGQGSRDPFDDSSRGTRVRTLATHGAIRVGVASTANVRDEAQVTAIMEDLARELDQRETGRTDDTETRIHEYQSLLNQYAGRLRPHMSGEFAFHAQTWILFHSVDAEQGSADASR